MGELIRHCPGCDTDRPLSETLCLNNNCGWPLSDVPMSWPGEAEKLKGEQEKCEAEVFVSSDSQQLTCPNGHEISTGDLHCFVCNESIPSGQSSHDEDGIVVDGWKLGDSIVTSVKGTEKFSVQQIGAFDHRRFTITFYSEESKPDSAIYPILSQLKHADISSLRAHGTFDGQTYQVWEELNGKSLDDAIKQKDCSRIQIPHLVEKLGSTLNCLGEQGIRHRNLRPSNVRFDDGDTPTFQVTGFEVAVHSPHDLMESFGPYEPSLYSAPEMIVGGTSSASDWWSLGIIILELVTDGSFFENVNPKAFLINVVTRGIEIPKTLPAETYSLLAGLLTNDASKRWQWAQVDKWCRGEMPLLKPGDSPGDTKKTGPSIKIAGKEHFRPENFALSSSEPDNWETAKDLLQRGDLTSWLVELQYDQQAIATINSLRNDNSLSDDFKLALSLMLLNGQLPLAIRGEIVNQSWMLHNEVEAQKLIEGSAAARLRQLDRAKDVCQKADRAAAVRKRLQFLEIDTDESLLRAYLLAPFRTLQQLWSVRYSVTPDSYDASIESLMQKRALSEEDHIILLSADADKFKSVDDVLNEVEQALKAAQIAEFDPQIVKRLLERPRLEIYEELESRLDGFSRCGVEKLDLWADAYRLEHRLKFDRVLALLSIPKERWVTPPKQHYVSNILSFFEKKILAKVNKGPLARQAIAKNSLAIDLTEFGASERESEKMLDLILERTTAKAIAIRQGLLEENQTLATRLSNLIKKTRIFSKDTGRHGLFLGFPYVMYLGGSIEEKRTWRAAPVILWPVKLDSNSSGRERIKLSAELQKEEVRLNPALEGLLGLNSEQFERWSDCVEEILRHPSPNCKQVLETLAQLAPTPARNLEKLPAKDAKPRSEKNYIVGSAVIFNCDFLGKSIADDLRQLKDRPIEGTALERAFRITTAVEPIQGKVEGDDDDDDDNKLNVDQYAVMELDPSQSEAITKANCDTGLHIEGPPGTGKSQTIVNIIADSIARDQTVLVICQKQAALSIVEKRLKARGLENRLFYITDVQKDRQPILKTCREQVTEGIRQGSKLPYFKGEHRKQIRQIQTLESELNEHHEQHYSVAHEIGLSYRNIIADLIGVDQSRALFVQDLKRIFSTLHIDEVSEIEESCASVAPLWFESKYEGSPLHALKYVPWDEAYQLELTGLFKKFFEAEEHRNETLNKFKESPNDTDVEPILAWLEENTNRFCEQTPESLKAFKTMMPLFSLESKETDKGEQYLNRLISLFEKLSEFNDSEDHFVFNKIVGAMSTKTLDSLLDFAETSVKAEDATIRNEARWKIIRSLKKSNFDLPNSFKTPEDLIASFNELVRLEERREHSLHEHPMSFDTENDEELETWLRDNGVHLLHLPSSGKQDLLKWFRHFDLDKDVSEGERIFAIFDEIDAELTSLNPEQHSPQLFQAISSLDSQSLSVWKDISQKAVTAGSPFKSAIDEQLQSRWKIVRFLHESKIDRKDFSTVDSELKDKLEDFIGAEEARVDWFRENKSRTIYDNAESIEEWLKDNKSFFSALESATREKIAQWFTLFDAEKGKSSTGNRLINELSELAQRISKLEPNWHDDTFSRSLIDLNPSELVERIHQAELVTKTTGAFRFLNPNCYISRGKLKQFIKLLGSDGEQSAMERFKQSAILERELRPIRSHFLGISKNLKLNPNDLSTDTRDEIDDEINGVLKSLQAVKSAVDRLNQNSDIHEARAMIASKNKRDFQNFVDDVEASIDLLQHRNTCLSKLKSLRKWFDEQWMQRYESLIRTQKHDLAELKVIWDSLPFFTESTFKNFDDAVALEMGLSKARPNFLGALEKLREAPEFEGPGTIVELTSSISGMRKRTAVVLDAVNRIKACPVTSQYQRLVVSHIGDDFENFIKIADGAIVKCRARNASRHALKAIEGWFESSWISERTADITFNKLISVELSEVEPLLQYAHDSVFCSFLAAVKLESELKPLRDEFLEILKGLGNSIPSDLSMPSELKRAIAAIQELYSEAAVKVKAINACPRRHEARAFAKKGTQDHFTVMIGFLSGIVHRARAVTYSKEALTALCEWFEQAWVSKREELISSDKVNLGNLEAIEKAFVTLKSFQLFRARTKSLSPRIMKVLEAMRKTELRLAQLPTSELPLVMRETIRKESRKSWKLRLEQTYPILSCESNELFAKMRLLKKETGQLMTVNQKMLALPDYSEVSRDSNEWKNVTLQTGARSKRLREFLENGTDLGLLKVRPIWLMDPEVASRVLPLKKGFFDKVIYDEASQLPVEYAIPTLYRAKVAIVSGDAKQMPPSDHFSSKIAADEDGPDEDVEDEYLTENQRTQRDEAWNRKEIKDCPDLLSLAADVFPDTRLEIHYRSKYKELITFSNAAFYGGSLNVPANNPEDEIRRVQPIQVIRADGVYKRQTNQVEAQKVIQVLKEIWKQEPRPSVGIVTFNFHQAALIMDSLSEEADRNAQFAQVKQLEEAREIDGEDMRFFVKNLENVQGDERDIIIFSTTFGPDENGKFLKSFGKLIQAGGERRLNVGITRAKEKVILVTSIPISSVSDCVQANRKPVIPREFFHCYLEYADRLSQGNFKQAGILIDKLGEARKGDIFDNDGIQSDAFVSSVKAFVEGLGYAVVESDRDNSAFAIDLAVINPKTGLFCVGIECDSPDHPLLKRAFHREWWRQGVLEKSIGVVHRIPSRDWLEDREGVQELLKEVIEEQIG